MAATLVAAAGLAGAAPAAAQAGAVSDQVKRGEYLVNFGGCHDCHTPLKMGPRGPEPDMSRALSGHPSTLKMPPAPKVQEPWGWAGSSTMTAFSGPWGVSYAINLTSDDTGVGKWTEEMFVTAMRTGKHTGVGRPILPPMPWQNVARLSDADLKAVFAYLKTVKPVKNVVPPPQMAAAPSATP
jgi:mono/diheme cytochrome c family protein